jgi:hypothetical protein
MVYNKALHSLFLFESKKNYIIWNLCKLSRDKIQFLKCLKFVFKSSKPFPFSLCVPGSSARQSKEKEEKEDGKEEKGA